MSLFDVEKYRRCATSAVRNSKNGAKVIKRLQKETGLPDGIIDMLYLETE